MPCLGLITSVRPDLPARQKQRLGDVLVPGIVVTRVISRQQLACDGLGISFQPLNHVLSVKKDVDLRPWLHCRPFGERPLSPRFIPESPPRVGAQDTLLQAFSGGQTRRKCFFESRFPRPPKMAPRGVVVRFFSWRFAKVWYNQHDFAEAERDEVWSVLGTLGGNVGSMPGSPRHATVRRG